MMYYEEGKKRDQLTLKRDVSARSDRKDEERICTEPQKIKKGEAEERGEDH